jgi:hypothetical protein
MEKVGSSFQKKKTETTWDKIEIATLRIESTSIIPGTYKEPQYLPPQAFTIDMWQRYMNMNRVNI